MILNKKRLQVQFYYKIGICIKFSYKKKKNIYPKKKNYIKKQIKLK